MAILAMKRINICAMKKDEIKLLETLQVLGGIEMNSNVFEEVTLETYNTLEEKMICERKAHEIDNGLEALNQYVPEKKGMMSSLEGKRLVTQDEIHKVSERKDELLSINKKILDNQKQLIENKVTIDRNQISIENLRPWLDLDIPMDFTHSKRVAFLIGTITHVDCIEEIYDAIGNQLLDISQVDVQIVHKDKYQTCVVAICLNEYEDSVEAGLHNLGFARISNIFEGIPTEEKQYFEDMNKALELENKNILKEMEQIAVHREDLKVLADYYRMTAKRLEAMTMFPQTEKAFFISGYIPAKESQKVEKVLNKKFDLFVEIEDVNDDEEVPVLLENNGVGGAVESVVGSYGLPKKGEIDPSNIMGFFYVILFGMMLGDVAYGLIITGTCFFLIKKFKRMEDSLKKALKLFMYCGISTFVWGLLFGGFFGDAVTVISETFFGNSVTFKPLWFAPLDDPMRLMMFCMLIGLIHLYTGLGIKGYLCIKDKRYMDFFCDVILWYCLITGLVMMMLPTELFYSLSQLSIVYPSWLALISKILAIGGAVGILLLSGRRKKNPALRLALGAYDLYGLTNWLSDLLSYSRLLALGLATGVIASVFNQIGSMFGNGPIGIIFFIIVFVIGHAFNLAINMLGSYVHTNRLQYVEFFGKFYEGGGRAFNPFNPNTKYVDIGEEK